MAPPEQASADSRQLSEMHHAGSHVHRHDLHERSKVGTMIANGYQLTVSLSSAFRLQRGNPN